MTTSAAAKWSWPLEGEVAAAFSTEKLTYNEAMGDWRAHTGIDIAAKVGDPVTAAMDGTVISVQDDVLLGKTVTVQTSDGLHTVYGNLADKLSGHLRRQGEGGSDHRQGGRDARREQHDTAWLHFAVEQDGQGPGSHELPGTEVNGQKRRKPQPVGFPSPAAC